MLSVKTEPRPDSYIDLIHIWMKRTTRLALHLTHISGLASGEGEEYPLMTSSFCSKGWRRLENMCESLLMTGQTERKTKHLPFRQNK